MRERAAWGLLPARHEPTWVNVFDIAGIALSTAGEVRTLRCGLS
jgi:hypothetical protein